MLNLRIIIEIRPELSIDSLIHPVSCLLASFAVKITVSLHKIKIAVNHIPHLIDSELKITRIGQHLGRPTACRKREQVERTAKLCLSQLRTLYIVAVSLIDHNAVSHLHDAALYALQLVTGTGKLNEQKEIHHRMHSGLALPHTYSFNKYIVISGSLAQHDGLASLSRHSSERSRRRAGAYECIRMHRQFLHSRLVAEYTPLGAFARRVDGKHSKLAPFFQDM